MLTYLIYFSGDIENPFIFFYIFHMVIASILLTNRAAYLQATLAIILLGGILLFVYLKIIPHHHLFGAVPEELYASNYPYFLIKFSVFVITLYITVYMSTTIVNKLRERENELELVNAKLEKQDRLKSEYVLTVSHDLKASLSAIQSCLIVVLSGFAGSISKKAREMITRAEQRSLSLIKFVEDLLNLSRIRASKSLEKQKISLSEIVKKTTEQLLPRIEQKNLNLSIKDLNSNLYVYANQRELEGVFMNLLLNAVKYTPSEGKIVVSCKKPKQGKYFQITVSDSGIGIPHDDLPHIFDDFYRGENAKVFDKDGTGLGLSIVKHIINDMGCEIWAESQLNKGTRFIFNLPAKA
jgi:signal transduction histidine kinase